MQLARRDREDPKPYSFHVVLTVLRRERNSSVAAPRQVLVPIAHVACRLVCGEMTVSRHQKVQIGPVVLVVAHLVGHLCLEADGWDQLCDHILTRRVSQDEEEVGGPH